MLHYHSNGMDNKYVSLVFQHACIPRRYIFINIYVYSFNECKDLWWDNEGEKRTCMFIERQREKDKHHLQVERSSLSVTIPSKVDHLITRIWFYVRLNVHGWGVPQMVDSQPAIWTWYHASIN